MSSRWEKEVGLWWLRARRFDGERLEHLVRRGLIQMPVGRRLPRRARVEVAGSVSDLVADQRR